MHIPYVQNPSITDTYDEPVSGGKFWGIWLQNVANKLESYPQTKAQILRKMGLKYSEWEIEPFLDVLRRTGRARRAMSGGYMLLEGAIQEAKPEVPETDPIEARAIQMEKLASEIINLKRQIEEADTEKKDLLAKLKDADKRGPIEIIIRDEHAKAGKKFKISMAHYRLPKLIMRLKARINVFLVGPAGSGKTTAAEQAAESLKLKFGFMSVGPQTTKSDIFGFMNAAGKYVTTEFRKRFEEGGVFLFDEIDAANPGVLTQINAALAGKSAAFPDGMVQKHPNFRCVAAGNTFGTGPDRQYVGRQELDAATLDRFNFLEWGYDEGLELAIAQAIDKKHADTWVPYVQKVRKAIGVLGIRLVVSPRCSLDGVRLLLEGEDLESVKETQLWKSLKPSEITRVTENLVVA